MSDIQTQSISGEVFGHHYTVDSHIVRELPSEEGDEGKVTQVDFTNLRVIWSPEGHTTISTLIESGTLTTVVIPNEDLSDFEYTFSNIPSGLDDANRDDVVRAILETLGLGKF